MTTNVTLAVDGKSDTHLMSGRDAGDFQHFSGLEIGSFNQVGL